VDKRDLDLSVIVVVYNQAESLKLILRSLLAQDFSGSYEIIVTDDGSSLDVFRVYCTEIKQNQISTKYVWQPDHQFRAAAARNNGIRISRGRIILFLDGDLVPALDTLRKHVEAHTLPKMIVAGNRKWHGEFRNTNYLPNGSIDEVINFLEEFSADEKSRHREEVERKRRKEWSASPYPWRACFSSNLSVEWSSDIYFDENFVGWGPEDWEFSCRLCTKHGYILVYRDNITTYHLETPSAVGNIFRTWTHEKIVMYMKNTFYFFNKCHGLPMEEVFFGFPRFILDPISNRWQVVPRPAPDSYDIKELVEKARRWLIGHGGK